MFPFIDMSKLNISLLASYGSTAGGISSITTVTLNVKDLNNFECIFATLAEVNSDYNRALLSVDEFKTGKVITLGGFPGYYAQYKYISDTKIQLARAIGDSRSTRFYGIGFN